METKLYSMWHKANVLKMPSQPLKDPLSAITTEISLPLPTYSPLWTILMAANDKLATDAVNNEILIEKKLRKIALTHLALNVKMTG